jgi:undecaprenyl-diphosphatase
MEMMSKIEAFILGVIQGFTEFLPISSTGHLYLGRHLFGLDEAGLFLDTMLHTGTLLAVLVIYKDELIDVIKHPLGKTAKLLVIGTIPAVIIGVLFDDFFDSISKSGVTIGWEFLVTGMILWMADGIRKGRKKMHQISYGDALFIGVAQSAAIMPALSRSGLTIAAALFRNLDRETAAYFSFLLSIPAIAGGVVYKLPELFSGGSEAISLGSLLVATIASALCGYVAVVWMIQFLQKRSLKIFAIYVWALGLIVLALQYTGSF